MEVIIKIKIDDTVIARMRKGEFVQGSLHYDQWNVRKSRMPGYVPESKTIAELDNGWMKETKTLIIRREAFQKRLPPARILAQMDRGNQQAKDVIIDRELIVTMFADENTKQPIGDCP